VKILDEVRSRHGFALLGYLLIPEHVHLLMSEPEHLTVTPSEASRRLFPSFAAAKESACVVEKSLPRFFRSQPMPTHYMHRNPVDRKLVQHSQDWPWSSWSFYAKGEQGLIRIDEPTPKAK
jgi:putative transposase